MDSNESPHISVEPAAAPSASASASAAEPAKVPGPAVSKTLPWPWHGLVTLLVWLSVVSLFLGGSLMVLPHLLARWRGIEARAEADAAYEKRRAELRAEADAGEDTKILDKRVDLVSLGFREVVRKVSPCVVNLTSYADQRDPRQKDSKDWPEIPDPQGGKARFLAATGSGIIVEPGWVLTNYHVVATATRVRVTFDNGHSVTLRGDRIKTDPLTDLAVLHLPSAPPGVKREDDDFNVEFGDSDKIERGDLVLALGSPLGLNHTVTHGIISAKGRLVGPIDVTEVLQTDAPINRGNSGGPLFDHHGRLIGINFAIASDNGFSQGIGFAIPSNTAKEVFRQLKTHGEVLRGYIGAELAELLPDEAQRWTTMGAARVGQVLADHPAKKAGLQTGDVVVGYKGEALSPFNPVRHLRQLIMDTKIGEEAKMDIIRRGKAQTVTITIGKRPPEQKK